MRKRTLGVVLVAGLAMSGAGAFTAANDDTAIDGTAANRVNVAGYSAATVTGAVVKSIDYTHDSANGSLLTQVQFVADTDLSAKEARVTLWNVVSGQADANKGAYACTGVAQTSGTVLGIAATATAPTTLFTCTIDPGEPIAEFNSVGITVNN